MMRGLGLGAACAGLIIACSAQHKMASQSPRASQPDAVTFADANHDEIERLERAIDDERVKLGFTNAAPPIDNPGAANPAMAMATGGAAPKSTDASCKHATSDTCGDVCTLSDSICDNAKKICDLALKMGNDAWAKGKCETATQSCDEANKKCCSCL